MDKLWKFLKDEQGTETVEWAIMIGLIAVGAIGLILGIGEWVYNQFNALYTDLASGSSGPPTPT